MASALWSCADLMMVSPGCLIPRLTTLKPLLVRIIDELRSVFRRKLSGDFPGDVDRCEIYLRDAVRHPEFGQNGARTPESVGLDHVATDTEEVGVNVTNNVGPA